MRKFLLSLAVVLSLTACASIFSEHTPFYSGEKRENSNVALYLKLLANNFFSDKVVFTRTIDGKQISELECYKDIDKRCPHTIGLLEGEHIAQLTVTEFDLWLPVWLRERMYKLIYEVKFSTRLGYIYGPRLVENMEDKNLHQVCIVEAEFDSGLKGLRESSNLVGCSRPRILNEEGEIICMEVSNFRIEPVSDEISNAKLDVYVNENCK